MLRSSDTSNIAVRQRQRLARLTGGIRAATLPAPLGEVAPVGMILEAVRCTGHSPRVRAKNSPLMHHKFVVRLQAGKPVAVWTGSFNFTANASSSLENAVEIHDSAVAEAYLNEFARVAAISEPMEFLLGKSDPNWSAKPRKSEDIERTPKPGQGTVKKATPRKRATAKKTATTARAATAKKTTTARKPTAKATTKSTARKPTTTARKVVRKAPAKKTPKKS